MAKEKKERRRRRREEKKKRKKRSIAVHRLKEEGEEESCVRPLPSPTVSGCCSHAHTHRFIHVCQRFFSVSLFFFTPVLLCSHCRLHSSLSHTHLFDMVDVHLIMKLFTSSIRDAIKMLKILLSLCILSHV